MRDGLSPSPNWCWFVVYCLCSLSEVQIRVDFYFINLCIVTKFFAYLANDSKLIGVGVRWLPLLLTLVDLVGIIASIMIVETFVLIRLLLYSIMEVLLLSLMIVIVLFFACSCWFYG